MPDTLDSPLPTGPSALADRKFTVLFADVAGSTRLYEQLGDAEALRRVGACLKAASVAASSYEGEVVKTIGDEIMCLFPESGPALLAACAMQSSVRDLPAVNGVPMALRIGFHSGPVLRRDGDVFGDTVNVAARIAALASAGQVLLGDAACQSLPQYLKYGIRGLGQATLRGHSTEMHLHEVVWDFGADLTLVGGTFSRRTPGASAALELMFGTYRWRLESGFMTIGRDPTHQIVLTTRRASRNHARIEVRQGKFVLRDASTNGSFVRPEDGEEVRLAREETVLQGRGSIFFGDPPSAEGSEELRYSVE
ncbi:MAG: adenylate/guanylate cyclase domain-containing protein [Betaproteobacteria bacterium]|jgi:class 3 adenylate cyclase